MIQCIICIVLYCIYTFIWRFLQCTPSRSASSAGDPESREQLRERKEALGSPANKVVRVEVRSWFLSEEPMIVNDTCMQWRIRGGKSGHAPPSKLAMELGPPPGQKEQWWYCDFVEK